MKRIFRHSLIIGLLLAGCESFAGGSFVGNGRDVLVCRNSNQAIQSVELLDLYEGRIYYGLKPMLNWTDSTKTSLNLLFGRSKLGNVAIKGVGDPLEDFKRNAQFEEGVTLPDVSDSTHLKFPRGCKVEQIVLKKNGARGKVTVNKTLWDRLDNANQAALVFHQVLYKNKDLKSAGNVIFNSRDIRYMVAVAAANKVEMEFGSSQEFKEFITMDLWIE